MNTEMKLGAYTGVRLKSLNTKQAGGLHTSGGGGQQVFPSRGPHGQLCLVEPSPARCIRGILIAKRYSTVETLKIFHMSDWKNLKEGPTNIILVTHCYLVFMFS